jgi:hypothetical protein
MQLSPKHQKTLKRILKGSLRVWICLIVFTFCMTLTSYTYAKVYNTENNLDLFLDAYLNDNTNWFRQQIGEPPMSFKVAYWSFLWYSRLTYPIQILHDITIVVINIGFVVGFILLFLYLNGWFPYRLFTYLSRCCARNKSLEEMC